MAELCENIRNFEDMATYYRYTRSAQNIQRYNFTLATTVLVTATAIYVLLNRSSALARI